MLSVLAITSSYLWNDFLYVFFFRSIFKEKYSKRITFWATIALWVIQFFSKIVPSFIVGLELVMYLSVFMLALQVV